MDQKYHTETKSVEATCKMRSWLCVVFNVIGDKIEARSIQVHTGIQMLFTVVYIIPAVPRRTALLCMGHPSGVFEACSSVRKWPQKSIRAGLIDISWVKCYIISETQTTSHENYSSSHMINLNQHIHFINKMQFWSDFFNTITIMKMIYLLYRCLGFKRIFFARNEIQMIYN